MGFPVFPSFHEPRSLAVSHFFSSKPELYLLAPFPENFIHLGIFGHRSSISLCPNGRVVMGFSAFFLPFGPDTLAVLQFFTSNRELHLFAALTPPPQKFSRLEKLLSANFDFFCFQWLCQNGVFRFFLALQTTWTCSFAFFFAQIPSCICLVE